MTRIRRFQSLCVAMMLAAALTASAQQTPADAAGKDKVPHGERIGKEVIPTADEQLKLFTEKLGLTSDQQAKVRRILQHLQEATEKIVRDKSLSHEEKVSKVEPERYKVDREVREILSDEQKQKLDQVEHEPHPELHGSLT